MGRQNQQPLDMNASRKGHDVFHGHRHSSEVGREFDLMCAERFREGQDSVAFTEGVLAQQIEQAEAAALPALFKGSYDGYHQRLGKMITNADEVMSALQAVDKAHSLTERDGGIVPDPGYYEFLGSELQPEELASSEDLANAA